MELKEAIRQNLNNPVYVIDGDIDVTSSVLNQVVILVKNVMLNKNISFEQAMEEVKKSDTFKEIENLNTNLWLSSEEELLDVYNSYNNTKIR